MEMRISVGLRTAKASMANPPSGPPSPTSDPSNSVLKLDPLKAAMSSLATATPPTVPSLRSEKYRLLGAGGGGTAWTVTIAAAESLFVLRSGARECVATRVCAPMLAPVVFQLKDTVDVWPGV